MFCTHLACIKGVDIWGGRGKGGRGMRKTLLRECVIKYFQSEIGFYIVFRYVIPKIWLVNCWHFTFFFLQLLGPISTIICPEKIWSNADFAPQCYGAIQILPRKFMELSFFAQQNYGAIQNLPSKIMEKCKPFPAKSQSHIFRIQHNC